MWRMSGEAVRAMAPGQLRGHGLDDLAGALGSLFLDGAHDRAADGHGRRAQSQALKGVGPVHHAAVDKDRDAARPMTRAISGRTISGGTAVGRMPWWCETTIPCTPASRHLRASTALSTPLMMKGSLVRLT